jgi:hypothetical protein
MSVVLKRLNMDNNSREIWLRTNEIEEFICGLEHCAKLVITIDDNVMHWKWLILALHNTLQGVCTCALRGEDTAGISMLTESSAKAVWHWLDIESRKDPNSPMPEEKLAGMIELYKRVQKIEYLKEPHRLPTHDQMNKDIRKLNELRNEFSHFVPKGFSLKLSGMPRIIRHCCDAIEHLSVIHPTFWHHLKEAHLKRIGTGLLTLRRALYEIEEAAMTNSEAQFNELSIELFRVFARIEYALKAAGFHYGDGE